MVVLLLQIWGGRNAVNDLSLGGAIHLKAVMIRGTIYGERLEGEGGIMEEEGLGLADRGNQEPKRTEENTY